MCLVCFAFIFAFQSFSKLIQSKNITCDFTMYMCFLKILFINAVFLTFMQSRYQCVFYLDGVTLHRNYYDTLEKLFGKKGVPQQLQAVLKVLPQNKRKLIQDVCDALNK